jgi:hypothetical protein
MTRILALSLTILSGAMALAQRQIDTSAIVGQWTGSIEGLPALRLVVQENDGNLTGAVLFYLIRREPGAAPVASPGFPEPMIAPVLDGKTLIFKINHRYAHPPGSLNDPPVSFRVEVSGMDKAKLFSGELPPLEITRQRFE